MEILRILNYSTDQVICKTLNKRTQRAYRCPIQTHWKNVLFDDFGVKISFYLKTNISCINPVNNLQTIHNNQSLYSKSTYLIEMRSPRRSPFSFYMYSQLLSHLLIGALLSSADLKIVKWNSMHVVQIIQKRQSQKSQVSRSLVWKDAHALYI